MDLVVGQADPVFIADITNTAVGFIDENISSGHIFDPHQVWDTIRQYLR
jgi:hypothetical protein